MIATYHDRIRRPDITKTKGEIRDIYYAIPWIAVGLVCSVFLAKFIYNRLMLTIIIRMLINKG